jgi:hypothetical protein
MSKAGRRRAALEAAGYNPAVLDRVAGPGRSRPRFTDPLCMVNHPERGRAPQRIASRITKLVYTQAWVPDERHPLGGYEGVVTVYRRVNLRKDDLPRWYRDRPLYEFTREMP